MTSLRDAETQRILVLCVSESLRLVTAITFRQHLLDFVHHAVHLPHREVERLIGRHVDARVLQQLDRVLRRSRPEERQIALPRRLVARRAPSPTALPRR